MKTVQTQKPKGSQKDTTQKQYKYTKQKENKNNINSTRNNKKQCKWSTGTKAQYTVNIDNNDDNNNNNNNNNNRTKCLIRSL